jgi:hypothetical protein
VLIERDVVIDGHAVKVHCHCLTVDANGRVQPRRLAEFMRNAVADYAIPRAQLAKAKERDARYNSTEAVAALVEQLAAPSLTSPRPARVAKCCSSSSRSASSSSRRPSVRWT